MARLVPSGQLLVLAKQYREGKFDARKGVWELSRLGPLSNMGTTLGELLFPLIHRVLTKSLPFITAQIQTSDWVRVWGTGGNVMNILTAASSIAPATVTRLRI